MSALCNINFKYGNRTETRQESQAETKVLTEGISVKLHWQLISLKTNHETVSETVIVTILQTLPVFQSLHFRGQYHVWDGFQMLMYVTAYLVSLTGYSCYILYERFNAFFLSLSGQLVQSSRHGNAQHKMGSKSLLRHKQIKVHNIMFVYKLGGYRNTVYNNNYIIDTMLSCMSTIFRSWLDKWLATFPHLYSLIYTAWNYIWMSLVEIWNRQKLFFKSIYLEIKLPLTSSFRKPIISMQPKWMLTKVHVLSHRTLNLHNTMLYILSWYCNH